MIALRQAYRAVVLDPENIKRLGWSKQTVMNRRVLVRKRKFPTEPVMRRALKRVGWKCVMEERWARP